MQQTTQKSKILSNFEVSMKKVQQYILLSITFVVAILLVACASIGRPEGGPRDETPPIFVKSSPSQGETNVKKGKLELLFDENLRIDDASNKVVISPVQKTMPSIIANAKKIIVELRDTLIPNTTYTIDFSDAIRDLNEGNPVDGFAIDFATGDSIDSLRISGMLFEARNLEPAQGMIVGVYSNLADSAISTLPLERISKTNQLGQFTIRGLKPGNYRLFALNDKNRDFYWDRTEDVAFYDVTVSPSVEAIEVTDTLRAVDGTDSLVVRQGVKYLPNDVLLTWFNEGYVAQYMKDYKRPDRRRLTFNFATKSDTLPQITLVNGPKAGLEITDWAVLNANATLDTLEYWINDTMVYAQDSMLIAARYLRTDTNEELTWTTDTLKMFFKAPKVKKDKKKKKKEEEEEADTLPPPLNFINWSLQAANPQDVNRPLRFTSSQPLASINNAGVRLSIKRDTIWEQISHSDILPDTTRNVLKFSMPHEWKPGERYLLEIDSAALMGIYNEWNKPFKQEFAVRPMEDYVNLFFNVSGTDLPIVVELLDTSDKVVATSPVVDGRASFHFLLPNRYFARAFIDRNNNGKYDTGNLLGKSQPEEIYYYSKRIDAKKNWDIEQSWDIYEQPLDLQKPYDIKKNKPARKKGEKGNHNHHEEEEEEDEFGDSYYGGSNSQRGSSAPTNRSGLRQNNL